MSMDKSTADCYVYSKASGSLSKSFIGNRKSVLFSQSSIPQLWSLLFSKEIPSLPQSLLVKEFEKTALNEFVNKFISLMENYERPEKVLITMLQFYEVENLKEIAATLCLGNKEKPELINIFPYSRLNYNAWPSLKEITLNSPYEWYAGFDSFDDEKDFNYRIDCQYIKELWASVNEIKNESASDLQKLFLQKIVVQNFVWALRLRIFYKMESEQIKSYLVYEGDKKNEKDLFAGEVIKSLDWKLDDFNVWSKSSIKKFLNPDSASWTINCAYINNAFQDFYVLQAKHLFHKYPSTCCPLVCWFIIKQDEVDNIRHACQRIKLGVNNG